MFYSNTNSDVLYDIIKHWYPDNFTLNDILTEEILIPAWNNGSKKPVFFSKYAYEKYTDQKMYKVPFANITLASSVNYNFFTPANLNW